MFRFNSKRFPKCPFFKKKNLLPETDFEPKRKLTNICSVMYYMPTHTRTPSTKKSDGTVLYSPYI